MAKETEMLIKQLIEEFRNVLFRWDTTTLTGQILITFGGSSRPDVKYQSDSYLSQISDSDSPSDIIQSRVIHHSAPLTKRQLFLDDQPTSPSHSYSDAQVPERSRLISSPQTKVSLPPFEKIIKAKNCHTVQGASADFGKRLDDQVWINQTIPQECHDGLGSVRDTTGECAVPLLTTQLACVDGSSPEIISETDTENCCGTESPKILTKSSSSVYEGVSMSEGLKDGKSKLKIGDSSLCCNDDRSLQKAESNNNATEDQSLSTASKYLDGLVNIDNLPDLSRTELINILIEIFQHKSIERQSRSHQILNDKNHAFQSSTHVKGIRSSRKVSSISSTQSLSLKLKLHPSSSQGASDQASCDIKSSDRKEENQQETIFKDIKRLERPGGDAIHNQNRSESSQNAKPLKKRTRLCTQFRNDSHSQFENQDARRDKLSRENNFQKKSFDDVGNCVNPKEKLVKKEEKCLKKASFKCKICMNSFSSRQDYRQHLRSHNGSFKCNICGKIMKTKDSLYHHQRGLHTKDKPYHCKDCNVSFNFYHSLKLHFIRHKGERPHNCKYCEKSYLTLYHLKEHVQAIHSNICIVCHICGKKFSYISALKLHLQRHSGNMPHSCSLCPKRFTTKYALKVHSSCHVSDKNFQCETCGKCFKSEYLRNNHSKKHQKVSSRYMCDICGKTFIYKCILESHVQIHSKVRPYDCIICDKSFKTKASLYSHKHRVHKEGLLFSCSVCGKLFKTKSCLTAHSKRHQNNVYSCLTCGATFPDKGGLNKHTRTIHSPCKCFVCKICGKRGTRADNMRSHVKSHKNEVSASSNPNDFFIEESAASRFNESQLPMTKTSTTSQGDHESSLQSSQKFQPKVQYSDRVKWIQPNPTAYENINAIDVKPSATAPSLSTMPPLFSQGSIERHVSDIPIEKAPGMHSQTSKHFKTYFTSDQAKTNQFLNYFCHSDVKTPANITTDNNDGLAFPTLVSTLNNNQESETSSPYSRILSHHHHHHHHHHPNYQTMVGAFPALNPVSRAVESALALEVNQEKTMTTL